MMKSIFLFIFILIAPCVIAQDLVFVFLHHRTDKVDLPKKQLDSIMEGHMQNIQRMAKDGKLLAAGPLEGGGGIYIFNSQSINEVNLWLQSDPGVKANRWKIEILSYHWKVGRPRLVSEPVTMTTYQLIRYTPYIAKFNINDVPELLNKHEEYIKSILKTGNVVAEGSFGDTEGGILVIKGELNRSVIESDPAVHEGLLEIEIKKWFVARGAFGEQQ
jgi:uncharacterized protein YciI